MTTRSEVIEWLRSHPDLFSRQPELLDSLNLAHGAGAASLIERQVDRLREENRRLNDKLTVLTAIAGENERLMQRLHQLTLDLLTTSSAQAFVERLADKLVADFQADCVSLHLLAPYPDLDTAECVRTLGDNRPEWFDQLVEQDRTECGRLTREKLDFLFGDRASALGSAALVPIRDIGLLAIGASAVERFHPGMGTLFLELLGATIRHRLRPRDADNRKRA